MQTGDRLSYHPEDALREVARFHATLAKAVADVTELTDAVSLRDQEQFEKRFGPDWKAVVQHKLATYQSQVGRAIVELQDIAEEASTTAP